jgi:nucleoid-associated protein YgaU
MAIGAVILVAAVLFVSQRWSSRDAPAPAPAESVPPPRGAPAARSAPIEPAAVPKAAPRRDDRTVAAGKPPAPAPGAATVAITELCRTFSMDGGSWRCDPAGNSVPPGRLVLYTRVKSTRDAVVVHRWYRGDTLRQSVRLAIQANPTEGYRTYSRQTVDAGDWRVEVRSADGSLLHEQRFAVR